MRMGKPLQPPALAESPLRCSAVMRTRGRFVETAPRDRAVRAQFDQLLRRRHTSPANVGTHGTPKPEALHVVHFFTLRLLGLRGQWEGSPHRSAHGKLGRPAGRPAASASQSAV